MKWPWADGCRRGSASIEGDFKAETRERTCCCVRCVRCVCRAGPLAFLVPAGAHQAQGDLALALATAATLKGRREARSRGPEGDLEACQRRHEQERPTVCLDLSTALRRLRRLHDLPISTLGAAPGRGGAEQTGGLPARSARAEERVGLQKTVARSNGHGYSPPPRPSTSAGALVRNRGVANTRAQATGRRVARSQSQNGLPAQSRNSALSFCERQPFCPCARVLREGHGGRSRATAASLSLSLSFSPLLTPNPCAPTLLLRSCAAGRVCTWPGRARTCVHALGCNRTPQGHAFHVQDHDHDHDDPS